jgi:hypothetical protein
MEMWCRGSFTEIVIKLRTGRSGIRIQVGGNLRILQNIQTSSGPTQTPIRQVLRLFTVGRRSGGDAEHESSPSPTVEVNEHSYAPFSPSCPNRVEREDFTFLPTSKCGQLHAPAALPPLTTE